MLWSSACSLGILLVRNTPRDRDGLWHNLSDELSHIHCHGIPLPQIHRNLRAGRSNHSIGLSKQGHPSGTFFGKLSPSDLKTNMLVRATHNSQLPLSTRACGEVALECSGVLNPNTPTRREGLHRVWCIFREDGQFPVLGQGISVLPNNPSNTFNKKCSCRSTTLTQPDCFLQSVKLRPNATSQSQTRGNVSC